MQIKGELFSRQFIPKLLDGTKIRTSRPCKIEFLPGFNVEWTGYRPVLEYGEFFLEGSNHRDATKRIKPKYQLGDIMYVRETYRTDAYVDGRIEYRASPTCEEKVEEYDSPAHWHPSIHMPREAARIFLRVTDVKVQRIGDLTEQDAIDDGFEMEYHGWSPSYYDPDSGGDGNEEIIMALDKFKMFWKKKYGADAQWMWVYYFERCEKPE